MAARLPGDIRKFHLSIDRSVTDGWRADGPPLVKIVSALVLRNPFAGQFGDDLGEMIKWGRAFGAYLGEQAVAALEPHQPMSYGKGAIVGVAGQQDHGGALLTTEFGNALRDAVGGGKAWISSNVKRGGPGTVIDIPLAHKDALYVRDNYDTVEVRIPDAPLPDEIAVVAVLANRGRINARCGGLKADRIRGEDGLV